MITKKSIVIFLSLGLYSLNNYAMEPVDQKRSQESRTNEAQLNLALFRSAASCMDRIIDRHQHEMSEELVEMITDTETKLAQTADQKERAELIDATTHFLAREAIYAPALDLWLKCSGKPNNIANISKISPLFAATQTCNIEGMKVLLADPRTIISKEELFLTTAIGSGSGIKDQTQQYKKILRLLLFFGVDPNAQIDRSLTAQEAADSLKTYDPEYSKLMKNHKNIAELLSPEERAEFSAIMKLRNNATHVTLMLREITGSLAKAGKKPKLPRTRAYAKTGNEPQAAHSSQPHNQAAAAAAGAGQASAITFKWPSRDVK